MPAPPEPGDRELMEGAALGDRDAFGALVRRHQGFVLSLAYRFLGDRSEAEDAAQEVFLRLWGAARRYRPVAPLQAYLRTLTANYCLDMRRRPRPVPLENPAGRAGTADPSRDLEASERRRALGGALQRLPSTQRMAIVLFHWEGVGVKDIAEILETSPKAVESMLSRGRASLRIRLNR